jgi:hypothetical protein
MNIEHSDIIRKLQDLLSSKHGIANPIHENGAWLWENPRGDQRVRLIARDDIAYPFALTNEKRDNHIGWMPNQSPMPISKEITQDLEALASLIKERLQ